MRGALPRVICKDIWSIIMSSMIRRKIFPHARTPMTKKSIKIYTNGCLLHSLGENYMAVNFIQLSFNSRQSLSNTLQRELNCRISGRRQKVSHKMTLGILISASFYTLGYQTVTGDQWFGRTTSYLCALWLVNLLLLV